MDSIRACRAWQEEEPYSSRPAILGSYLSAIGTDDYHTSEEFARKGLTSNYEDAMVLNNLVVALVNQGKLAESEKYFVRLNQVIRRQGPVENRPVWLATNGLVAFRRGNWALGRALYFEAVEKVRPSKNLTDDNFRALVLALVHHAIEESVIDANLSGKLRGEAQELIKEKRKSAREGTPAWVALVEGLLERRLGESTQSIFK